MTSLAIKFIEEGREERSIEFARKLLKRGRPIEEIVEDTELNIEKVLEIKKEME